MFDTPISELALTGAAYGAAITGLRPVLEIMFGDFLGLSMDSLINQITKYWFLTGGTQSVPMVIRSVVGAGGRFGAIHSQMPISWLMGVPGLKIVAPSTPADAKGLLQAAIRDDNPVVFFEHKRLYQLKGDVPEGDPEPLGRARVLREGGDVTLVSAMKGVHERDVASLAQNPRAPERFRISLRHVALQLVEALVLEEDDGVVIADRRLQEALRVGRCRGRDDLQARHPHQPRDGHLRVDGSEATACSDDRANDHRHALRPPGEEPVLRDLVDQAVHREPEEVPEHDLEHRPEPRDRRAIGGAGQRQLGDRRVEHAARAVLLAQTDRHRKDTAGVRDVLAEQDHPLVPCELLVERRPDRGAEVEPAHVVRTGRR